MQEINKNLTQCAVNIMYYSAYMNDKVTVQSLIVGRWKPNFDMNVKLTIISSTPARRKTHFC